MIPKVIYFLIKDNYSEEENIKFKNLLQEHLNNLNNDEKENIYQQGLKLKDDQELKTHETADNLPMIKLKGRFYNKRFKSITN